MEEPDKILVRSNGTVTYTGKDIAYQIWKFGLLGADFGYERLSPGWSSGSVEPDEIPRAVRDHPVWRTSSKTVLSRKVDAARKLLVMGCTVTEGKLVNLDGEGPAEHGDLSPLDCRCCLVVAGPGRAEPPKRRRKMLK